MIGAVSACRRRSKTARRCDSLDWECVTTISQTLGSNSAPGKSGRGGGGSILNRAGKETGFLLRAGRETLFLNLGGRKTGVLPKHHQISLRPQHKDGGNRHHARDKLAKLHVADLAEQVLRPPVRRCRRQPDRQTVTQGLRR